MCKLSSKTGLCVQFYGMENSMFLLEQVIQKWGACIISFRFYSMKWNFSKIFPLIHLSYATHKLAFDKFTTYKLTELIFNVLSKDLSSINITSANLISMNLFSIKLLSVILLSTIQLAFAEWVISLHQTDFIFR